jgi:hypothetical protein
MTTGDGSSKKLIVVGAVIVQVIALLFFSNKICSQRTFKGDPRAWLQVFFTVFTLEYILSPSNVFLVSYRGYGLAIIILHLILYDDFDIMGIVIDISCHTTDLGNWVTSDNS